MTKDYASIKSVKRSVVVAAISGEFLLLFIIYCTTPGYIIPFLNNPIARIVLFFMLLWQVLGVALYAVTPINNQRHILFAFQNTFFVLVFVLPLLFVVLVGPAAAPHPVMAM